MQKLMSFSKFLKVRKILEESMEKFSGDLEDSARSLLTSGWMAPGKNYTESESVEPKPVGDIQSHLVEWLAKNV